MTNQSLHDLDRCGETRESVSPLALATELILPAAGARVVSFVGDRKTVGQVFLAPGSGLSEHDCEQVIAAHAVVNCSIRAEAPHPWQEPPQPVDFHSGTLRWMFKTADYICIWSAPFPQYADEVATTGIKAIEDGAEFMVTIETTPERAAEWAELLRRWKRKKAKVAFFGPENGAPAGAADVSPAVVSASIPTEGRHA